VRQKLEVSMPWTPWRRRRGAILLTALLGSTLAGGGATAAVDAPPPLVGSIDLDSTTIPELQALMDSGELTSEALVQSYLDRIEILEPHLNAIIAISPSALDDARAADEARAAGTALPLLGIPVLIKDNINTTGMPTTAGSLALAESSPPDAFLVSRLRDAGAIILGKANLSEWANMRSYPSSSGWSAVGGQTNNPYALDRNPCGSSSGSAVGVAASLASVAVGTETDGSIICPASATGVVGIKPSLGLVSRSGVVPISSKQDTAGPLARNVTDAAILLEAMAGADPSDPITTEAAIDAIGDWTGFLDAGALEGARIGVWRAGQFGLNPPVDAIMEDTIARLEELGATIVDPADLDVDAFYDTEFTALLCEFKHEIGLYLETLDPGLPRSLQELIDFNIANADVEMAAFKQETFDEAQAAPAIDDPSCVEARESATRLAQATIDETMAAGDLDAIIAPAGEPAWLSDPVVGDTFIGPYSAPAAAVAGYPSITIPAGYVSGLPVGISFIGANFSEPTLLGLAYALEQGIDVRVPPTFPDSVVLEAPAAGGEAGAEEEAAPDPSPSPAA
jgi:amidase